jgi:hypothetical protein
VFVACGLEFAFWCLVFCVCGLGFEINILHFLYILNITYIFWGLWFRV